MKGYVKKKLPGFTKEEIPSANDYLFQLNMRNGPAEKAISKLLILPILAHTPIFDNLDTYRAAGITTYFVYGDRDWLDTFLNGPPVSEQLREKGENVYVIENSD
eukprot:CAMPEP_0197001316 /NCGR_PEP_ID=MMETSP1380-20130617/6039_1 /TAXON_ID=5936 /ORGANISM="Euplotes crassus, Strain CT5" /LENGTH=103 /DNA_ID=CAMNT_0042418925 /DNA_START=146 /DNA_END=454 /DNA_ORIENTATION=+